MAEQLAPTAANRRLGAAMYPALFVLAFAARFLVAQVSGGLSRIYLSYDAGVYYAAADALTFGRLPYRDFVLLHPPGLPIVLTPFAALGRITDDRTGFMVAVVAFMALGAVNAVLTAAVCVRIGMTRAAAALGGAFYALWLGSARAEYQIRLEPLGNLLILAGLLAYLSSRRTGRRADAVWVGAAFGAAASVKIWWALPLVLLVAWHLTRDRRPNLVPVVAGAAAALVVIDAPFAVAAPSQMWHMVVVEQLTRPVSGTSPATKAVSMVGSGQLLAGAPHWLIVVVTALGAVAVAAAAVAAWRLPAARLPVVLLVAQTGVLLATPSWFVYYSDYLAPVAAVTVAAGFAAHRGLSPRRRGRHLRWAAAAALLGAAAVVVRFVATGTGAAPKHPSAELTAAASRVRCVMSDSPSGLILLDALSRGLRNDCPNWIDVRGRIFGLDAADGPDGAPLPPADNPVWQAELLDYLTSGDAVYLIGPAGARADEATLRAVRSGAVLARSGGDVLYLTP